MDNTNPIESLKEQVEGTTNNQNYTTTNTTTNNQKPKKRNLIKGKTIKEFIEDTKNLTVIPTGNIEQGTNQENQICNWTYLKKDKEITFNELINNEINTNFNYLISGKDLQKLKELCIKYLKFKEQQKGRKKKQLKYTDEQLKQFKNDGLTLKEIAKICSVSVNTIKSRLSN